MKQPQVNDVELREIRRDLNQVQRRVGAIYSMVLVMFFLVIVVLSVWLVAFIGVLANH